MSEIYSTEKLWIFIEVSLPVTIFYRSKLHIFFLIVSNKFPIKKTYKIKGMNFAQQ